MRATFAIEPRVGSLGGWVPVQVSLRAGVRSCLEHC